MSKAKEQALELLKIANDYGWSVVVRNGGVLTIKKVLDGEDKTLAFAQADSEYYGILEKLPTTGPGSVWGSDGGGVGAVEAMNNGVFTMNKSGGSKRVLNALRQLVGG